MFTSRELNTFISVAERMSIKLAAEDLNITSPAVCSMIKKLEGRINNKLFIFEKNKMTLTSYGQRIYALTEGHFHTLRSLELKMRTDSDIVKISIKDNLSFLSHFITGQFKKRSTETLLTSRTDESTDLVITDELIMDLEDNHYDIISANLFLYLVYDKQAESKHDIFIHKDYAALIHKNVTQREMDKIEIKLNATPRLIISESTTSMIETATNSLGTVMLPHTCSLLKRLENSRLGFEVKRIELNIPIHIYARKKIDHEAIKLIFTDALKV